MMVSIVPGWSRAEHRDTPSGVDSDDRVYTLPTGARQTSEHRLTTPVHPAGRAGCDGGTKT
jgi:hypothetical protein